VIPVADSAGGRKFNMEDTKGDEEHEGISEVVADSAGI
jgi:hypothetical protein